MLVMLMNFILDLFETGENFLIEMWVRYEIDI